MWTGCPFFKVLLCARRYVHLAIMWLLTSRDGFKHRAQVPETGADMGIYSPTGNSVLFLYHNFNMKGTKTCTKCSLEKSTDDFKKSTRSTDGRFPQCKACEARYREARAEVHRAYMKTYYRDNKTKFAKENAKYQEAHKEGRKQYNKDYYYNRRMRALEWDILYRIRSRSKKQGIKFNLTREDIVVPEVCPVLGIPLNRGGIGIKGARPDSPSVDRIRPELGYVKGNVRVISNRANTLKCDASIEELERVLQDLRSQLSQSP